MQPSSLLLTLAQLLAGEFDNREQAIADPAWFVHLKLWQRPVPLFTEDSITLFAEQANVLQTDRPYRQRLLRLMPALDQPQELRVQYYAFKDPSSVRTAGQHPERLEALAIDEIEHLPGCILHVTQPQPGRFAALAPADTACYFSDGSQRRQVCLGFEAEGQEFFSYDKGVDPETGEALWGAIMGPYRFTKRSSYGVRG